MVKFGRAVSEIYSRTDRQIDRPTDRRSYHNTRLSYRGGEELLVTVQASNRYYNRETIWINKRYLMVYAATGGANNSAVISHVGCTESPVCIRRSLNKFEDCWHYGAETTRKMSTTLYHTNTTTLWVEKKHDFSHCTLARNFAKCWPIFARIASTAQAVLDAGYSDARLNVAWSVCLCVGYTGEPCKIDWIDRNAVGGGWLRRVSKEPLLDGVHIWRLLPRRFCLCCGRCVQFGRLFSVNYGATLL